MIDTIRLRIPIDVVTFSKIKSSEHVGVSTRSGKGLSYNKAYALIPIPGFRNTIYVEVSSRSQTYTMFVEFSVPHAVLGSNLVLFYPEELPKVLEMVKLGIERYFTDDDETERFFVLPEVSKWVFNRLDICYVWRFEKPEHARMYLEALKHFDYPRKPIKIYETSVSGLSDSGGVRWYLKYDELIQSKEYKLYKKHELPITDEYEKLALGCLRLEIESRNQKLQTLFQVKEVRVHHLKNRTKLISILKKEMRVWLKGLNPSLASNLKIKHELVSRCSSEKAAELFQFYAAYTIPAGKPILKSFYDNSTINRKLKQLSEAGVSLRGSITLPDSLSIPSPLVPNASNNSLPDCIEVNPLFDSSCDGL